jgi:hypothetical protein
LIALFHRNRSLVTALCCAAISAVAWSKDASPRTVHVFVALADNQHQGIVPVPARLGNGDDPDHNLYWRSAYGVKTFFARSADWVLVSCSAKPKPAVLERCVFRHRTTNTYVVADAYRGSEIREAILDFLGAAAGASPGTIVLWTTNLMAPEAYTLKSALDGWIGGEKNEQIRDRAARAYDKYQKCGFKAAHRLFSTDGGFEPGDPTRHPIHYFH